MDKNPNSTVATFWSKNRLIWYPNMASAYRTRRGAHVRTKCACGVARRTVGYGSLLWGTECERRSAGQRAGVNVSPPCDASGELTWNHFHGNMNYSKSDDNTFMVRIPVPIPVQKLHAGLCMRCESNAKKLWNTPSLKCSSHKIFRKPEWGKKQKQYQWSKIMKLRNAGETQIYPSNSRKTAE